MASAAAGGQWPTVCDRERFFSFLHGTATSSLACVALSPFRTLRTGRCSQITHSRIGAVAVSMLVAVAVGLGAAAPAAAAPTALPTPEDGYGSYHHEFHINGIPRYRAVDILPTLNTDFDRWFPYKGCGKRIAVGTVCQLQTPFGTGPVKVIALADDAFALKSLPGHFEGPDRIIRFMFLTADVIGHPTFKSMHVDAWGPVSKLSLGGPINGIGSKVAAWQPFADTINIGLPKEPLVMAGAV